jgi:predicted DNA binding CopG/RHH family protein
VSQLDVISIYQLTEDKRMEKQHKTMRLSKDVIERVKKMAEEEGRSFNNMVERLLDKATA